MIKKKKARGLGYKSEDEKRKAKVKHLIEFIRLLGEVRDNVELGITEVDSKALIKASNEWFEWLGVRKGKG